MCSSDLSSCSCGVCGAGADACGEGVVGAFCAKAGEPPDIRTRAGSRAQAKAERRIMRTAYAAPFRWSKDKRHLSAATAVALIKKRRGAGSALARLEALLRLVDDVDAALATHEAVVAMAPAERLQGITDLHGITQYKKRGQDPRRTISPLLCPIQSQGSRTKRRPAADSSILRRRREQRRRDPVESQWPPFAGAWRDRPAGPGLTP